MRFTAAALLALSCLVACGDDDDTVADAGPDAGAPADGGPASKGYVIGSVVIDPQNNRTTYVQVLPEIPTGHIDNTNAIEISGNGVFMARGSDIFIGLVEEPSWVKYSVDDAGQISQQGKVSFAALGLTTVDYGNVIVDDHTAVSISSSQRLAIIWDTQLMEIVDTVELPALAPEGDFDTEVWTTRTHGGLVYIPGRWANWDDGIILPKVQLTIFDPATRKVVGVAEDERCGSGGQPIFGPDGTAYVAGDGRSYALQMYAHARGEVAPKNCILRIKPGETDFDPTWMVEVTSLTGGLESITELELASDDSGVAFVKLFYPDQLPEGVEPIDFSFWNYSVFKQWRIQLGDTPTASVVEGAPFSGLGFSGSAIDGKLYTGETSDGGGTTVVYESDPVTNKMTERFTMDGSMYGFARLE